MLRLKINKKCGFGKLFKFFFFSDISIIAGGPYTGIFFINVVASNITTFNFGNACEL